MFARDHGRGIFAEQQLAAGGVFRRDHIDGLVGVHVYIAVAGQLAGHAGADDLGAVQAEDGIHDGGVGIRADQFQCHGARFGKAGLLHGNVNVIIDMAVACGKVPLCHAQYKILFLGG